MNYVSYENFFLIFFLLARIANPRYRVKILNVEVQALPELKVFYGKSLFIEKTPGNHEAVSKSDTIKIDDRYFTTRAKASIAGHFDTDTGQPHVISVLFGDNSESTLTNLKGVLVSDYKNIGKFKGELPISIQYYNYHIGCVNVSVECELTNEAKNQWKFETFNAIITAYEERLKEYNEKMASLKLMQVQKVKMNPMFYRQIENTLLRKNCIEYMISHQALGGTLLTEGADLQTTHVLYDNINLENYAAKVKFFEQAFEWNLMSYNFYPFYWAPKNKWQDLYTVEEVDDPLFRSFLQSGMARVILTVRPGFEELVNWYMATGQIWNGGQVPTINDPLFVSIIKELQETEGAVEETWESRVPTSLTVIQAGTIGLNVEGLPCNDDCEDNLMFNSDGTPALDTNGNQIQIIGQNPDTVQLGNITDELTTVAESIEEIKTDIEEIKTTLNASN